MPPALICVAEVPHLVEGSYPGPVPADRRVGTDLCFRSERLDRERTREGEPSEEELKPLSDAERDLLAPLLDGGFELVGTGVARIVLRFPAGSSLPEYVVKLARLGPSPVSFGVNQNRREATVRIRHGVGGQWPLVPVADYHRERFRWLVMPYGESITGLPDDETVEYERRVHERLRMLPAIDLREVWKAHVVLVDGEPLLADYGLPEGG